MEDPIKQGDWTVWRDCPEFGCTDNPSYDWFARKSKNGHGVLTVSHPDLTTLLESIKDA